jgi:hypothetical protein
VQLTDQVCVLAFQDRSMRAGEALLEPGETATAVRGYIWNLVRPMAFTFLRDCVRIGGLRLSEHIAVVIDTGHPPSVDIELQRSSITPENGSRLLFAL